LNTIPYTGEHLFFGQLGNSFVYLSFVAALLAAFSYFRSAQHDELDDGPWRRLGKMAFYLHSIGVIGIMTTLFYMIFHQ
jgi:cytochrome c-type biogenesis protein CcmF